MNNFLLLIFVFSSTIIGQQIKSWQNHTDMQQINDLDIRDGIIWGATSGGIYSYSQIDNSYKILTKSEGLSSHSITSIAIDDENKIWIGTTEGYINVYNPSTSEIHTIYQIFKTDRSNKRINDIQISGDTAFVSTEFGLSLVNTSDYSFFDSILKFGNFTSETPVANVFLKNTIYVVTQAGIAVNKAGFNNLTAPESWNNISLGSEIPASKINRLTEFNNQLYAATDKGVVRENNGIWERVLYNNFEIMDIFVDKGSIYSLLSNSINKYSANDEIILTIENANFNRFIQSENSLYIGSNDGIIEYNGTENFTFNPNMPATNSIINITVDSEGNLWSATGKDVSGIGILKFDKNEWNIISKDNNSVFSTNSFHKVSSSNTAVYFSNWGDGFIKYKEENYTKYNTENTDMIGIPGSNSFLTINDIEEDMDGNAWILNYWSADRKPLSVLTAEGEIYNYEFSSPLSPQVVTVDNMIIDQYNTKWFAGDLGGDVATEGLFYFNENGTFENTSDDVWGKLTQNSGLRSRDVKALAIDQFGELIIGTSTGVDVISNPSNPNSIRGDQYFAVRQQTINCIEVDPINQKWFGTEKGIFLTSADGSVLLANYTKSNSPLPSDNIKSLAIDKKSGIVYVGTDFGLTAISTLFIQPNKDFSELFVYPNPVNLTSSSDINIIIDGLIEDSEIKILDIAGNLINEFRSIGGKTTSWNCRDLNGQLISSGVYIVVAFDVEVNEIGHAKFAVLRK